MDIDSIREVDFSGPTRVCIHSVEGFGKTTLAAFFPNPVFICPERGWPRDLGFKPKAFPQPKTWEDVLGAVRSLITSKHDYGTVVFDTMDWIEPLVHRFVCDRDGGRKTEMNKGGHKLESIEDYGYGKGYIATQEQFRALIAMLDELQAKRGMHVVVLVHSKVATFRNPGGEDFDRYQLKMHERSARVFVEWCEQVVFGYFEVVASKGEREPKAKGVSTGRRILGTRQNAMYDAKNRVNLPDTVVLEDPREMVPYLLGAHLHDTLKPANAAPPPTKDVAPELGKVAEVGNNLPAVAGETTDARKQADIEANEQAKLAKLTQLDDKLASDVADMLTDAEAKLGKKYRSNVESWLAKAGSNVSRIEAIFTQVATDMKAQQAHA